jgi:hypothetical protein
LLVCCGTDDGGVPSGGGRATVIVGIGFLDEESPPTVAATA